ncbi:acyl carrier protein [Tsukamurella sp. 8F]|uniref:acyl carrier protein n=1 Tax=unclassified Tsukamurella TaxID=2633480 RepID=UPI0023B93178|nr:MULTISPECIES: acyl carrier protein [unclassified Tsukamurella]MDF0529495.1 acyl carrier protein [Tsukamurella sp. 8J]MDF0585817.1 acyl carrier protein [Tsukamurella sp. 8F]
MTSEGTAASLGTGEPSAGEPPATAEEIVQWCRLYLADLLETAPENVDPDTTFDRLGIDSAHAVALLIEVEQRYGVELPPDALFDHPTLNAVSKHLHDRLS